MSENLINDLEDVFGEEALEYEIKVKPFRQANNVNTVERTDDGDLVLKYEKLDKLHNLSELQNFEYEVNFTEKTIRIKT